MRFTATGKPVGKGRPRFRRRGDYVQTYTPDQTLDWEQNVAWQVKQQLLALQMAERLVGVTLPLEGRVLCDLRFNIRKPKSAPKKLTNHLKKPDLDNLVKAVLDALTTVQVIRDDNIVTDLTTCKRFADDEHPEGVEIELTAWL